MYKSVAFGCTGATFAKGPGYDREVAKGIRSNAPGSEVVTTSGAVVEALSVLGIKRVAVATPFPKEVDERAKRFLEGNGFTVTDIKGLGIVDSLAIGKMPPRTAYELAQEVNSEECDGIFISCTNFPTAEIIESLEQDLGKPIVTSNQATLWASLRRLGWKASVEGYGRLLRELGGTKTLCD